jgi:hypothetical protein
MDAQGNQAKQIPKIRRTWNERVYAIASSSVAVIFAAAMIALLVIVVRWVAHITGVWPLP